MIIGSLSGTISTTQCSIRPFDLLRKQPIALPMAPIKIANVVDFLRQEQELALRVEARRRAAEKKRFYSQ